GDEGPVKDVRLKSQGEKDAERRRFLEDRVAEFNRGEYDAAEDDEDAIGAAAAADVAAIRAAAGVGNNGNATYDEDEDTGA
ncbi:hypothetical protein THAOC_12016, partial [Thalassiosira oceanica]